VELSHWPSTLNRIGAVGHYNGGKDAHFVLASGIHSDTYVNMTMLASFPKLLEAACAELINKARSEGEFFAPSDSWFIGPEKGAITIAHEFARQLGVRCGYTEKNGVRIRMELQRFHLRKRDRVFLVEDVMTTGVSILKTLHAVEDAGGVVQSPIFVLCNRRNTVKIDDIPVISLTSIEGNEWSPAACPLCKEGSAAVMIPKKSLKFF